MSLIRTLAPIVLSALALALGCLIVVGVRLSQGPIPLPGLTARIENGLSALSPDLVARVSRTELAWDSTVPDLRVVDVALARRNGDPIAVVPALAVRPSLRALLHGQFAARRIAIYGVRASVVRDATGALRLAGINGAKEPPTPIDLAALFGGAGAGGSAMDYLREIVIGRSEVLVQDDGSGATTHFSDWTTAIFRRGAVVSLRSAADLSVSAPKAVAFRTVSAEVALQGQIVAGRDGRAPIVVATVNASGGTLTPGGDAGAALPLRSFATDASYELATGQIRLASLHTEVGTATVDGNASALGTPAGWEVSADAEIRTFAVAELRRFWPAASATSARHWILENIPEGTVSNGHCAIRLHPKSPAADAVAEEPVDLRFQYQGLVVRYFGELDPTRSLQGTGHLTSHGFEARVASGEIGQMKLANGSVDIDFQAGAAKLTTSADLSGPAASILEQLGRQPLDIPAKIGLDPSTVSGVTSAHVEVAVPLHAGVSSHEVHWNGHADVTDARVPNLVGAIGVENAKLQIRVDDRHLEIEGDLVPSGVPELSSPAHTTLRYDPTEDGNRVALAVDGDGASGEGTATFAEGRLRELSVAKLRFGGTELSGTATSRADGGYHVSFDAPSIDLEPMLRGDKTGRDIAKGFAAAYDGDFRVKKLLFGGGIEMHDLDGTGSGAGTHLQQLTATATIGNSGPLDISLAPRRSGSGRRLRVRSQNAGEVLRALGVFAEADGGQLTFIVRFGDDPEQDPTGGLLSVRDFRIIRAPVLARILSAGSISGIDDLIHGEGLTFSRARVPFRWKPGHIDIVDAGAVGPMGLTAQGTIDRIAGRLELRGRVIPAYTLNSALGKIPYVGDFLVGGKGEGVFGIEYHVSGPFAEPDVSVNPLSALAPGALRKLFVDPFTHSDDDTASDGDR